MREFTFSLEGNVNVAQTVASSVDGSTHNAKLRVPKHADPSAPDFAREVRVSDRASIYSQIITAKAGSSRITVQFYDKGESRVSTQYKRSASGEIKRKDGKPITHEVSEKIESARYFVVDVATIEKDTNVEIAKVFANSFAQSFGQIASGINTRLDAGQDDTATPEPAEEVAEEVAEEQS